MIRVRCPSCQKLLGVPDDKAGRAIVCPACKGTVRVPTASSSAAPPRPAVAPAPPKKPAPVLDELDIVDDDETPEVEPEPLPEPAARPRKKKKKRPARSTTANAEILTGVLMMVGAVVWFVGGLFVNVIFFYPPILFALGIAAVVRGMQGTD